MLAKPLLLLLPTVGTKFSELKYFVFSGDRSDWEAMGNSLPQSLIIHH